MVGACRRAADGTGYAGPAGGGMASLPAGAGSERH